jgi:hypothetical protein
MFSNHNPHSISLTHQQKVTNNSLNHLWDSLTSKKHFFDTPVKESHLLTKGKKIAQQLGKTTTEEWRYKTQQIFPQDQQCRRRKNNTTKTQGEKKRNNNHTLKGKKRGEKNNNHALLEKKKKGTHWPPESYQRYDIPNCLFGITTHTLSQPFTPTYFSQKTQYIYFPPRPHTNIYPDTILFFPHQTPIFIPDQHNKKNERARPESNHWLSNGPAGIRTLRGKNGFVKICNKQATLERFAQ